MNKPSHGIVLLAATCVVSGCATTCGPGTVETDGSGWRFERDGLSVSDKVCLPVSPITDCTTFQMKEEDGGGWRVDRDGGGWRVDRDGAGWRVERDAPKHPGQAGNETVAYVPSGLCRIGVPPID